PLYRASPVEGAQQRQRLGWARPEQHQVAGDKQRVRRGLAANIGQHRFERHQIAVDIGKEHNSHHAPPAPWPRSVRLLGIEPSARRPARTESTTSHSASGTSGTSQVRYCRNKTEPKSTNTDITSSAPKNNGTRRRRVP